MRCKAYLKVIKYRSMVEVSMRENPVDPSTHRAQLRHRGFFDAHSVRKYNHINTVNSRSRKSKKSWLKQTVPQ